MLVTEQGDAKCTAHTSRECQRKDLGYREETANSDPKLLVVFACCVDV